MVRFTAILPAIGREGRTPYLLNDRYHRRFVNAGPLVLKGVSSTCMLRFRMVCFHAAWEFACPRKNCKRSSLVFLARSSRGGSLRMIFARIS